MFFVAATHVAAQTCNYPQYYYDYITYSGTGCSSSTYGSVCTGGQPITFSIGGSYTLQSCDTVSWTFGDGATATGNSVTHTYTVNGFFTVRATISNSVAIGSLPSVGVGVSTISGCPLHYPEYPSFTYTGLNCSSAQYGSTCGLGAVTFTVKPSYNSTTYEACDVATWNFSDGTKDIGTAGVFTTSHSFTTAGSYWVNVSVANALGTTSTGAYYITVANGTVTLSTATTSYVEGSTAHFAVTRTNPNTGPLSVNYATTDGTAKAGTDYTAASGTLNFATGETTKSFDVPTIDDSVFTGTRSFSVALSSATNGYLISPTYPTTISITDNDLSVLAFSSTSFTALKTDGSMTVTVVRTGVVAHPVSVAYSVSPCCYPQPPFPNSSGSLNFAGGETSKNITIPITNYNTYTGDQSGSIYLFSPSAGATFAGSCTYCNPSVQLIIKETNPRPTISLDDASTPVGSGGTTAVPVRIHMSAPLSASVTGSVTTTDGTAKAGTDYVLTNAFFTIPAGQLSATVTIPIIGKATAQPDKWLRLTLSNLCCSPLTPSIDKGLATLTILDDKVGFGPATQSVPLGSSAGFVMSLGLVPSSPVTMTLSSSNPGILNVPASVMLTDRRTSLGFKANALGDTTITATLPPPYAGAFTGNVHVYETANLVLKPSSMVIPEGSSLNVAASFDPALTTASVVQLKANDPSIIDVPSPIAIDPGKSTAFTVTALKRGSTVLTATTAADHGGQQFTFLVDVVEAPKTPAITQITPANGPVAGGTNVTISGANLATACAFFFGGAPASNVAFVSATSMTATTPPHPAGTVDVLLSCGSDSFTFTGGFTYVSSSPTLAGVAPAFGSTAGGTLVRITGANFRSGCWPFFDTTAAPWGSFISATEFLGESPEHAAGKVAVALRCSGGNDGSLTNAFTYVAGDEPAPLINSVAPLAGSPGESITLTGARFRRDDTVKFADQQAAILFASPDTDRVRVPEISPGDVAITLTDKAGRSTTTGPIFTVLEPEPPHITSATPTTVRPGMDVALDGTGFRPGYSFGFGSTRAALVSLAYTHVVLRVPDIAPGAYPLDVFNSAGKVASIGPSMTVAASGPSISNITPACGSTDGGGAMTIHGSGFEASTVVTFDGTIAVVHFVDANTLNVTIPAGAVGAPRIVITNASGASAALTGAFMYFSPFDPNGGCSGGRNRPMRH